MPNRPVLAAVQAQQKMINGHGTDIEMLKHQLAVTSLQLAFVAKLAGVSDELAAIQKQADADNPAQPIPNPPSEQAFETTEEAVTPETQDDPQNPGETPGSVQNLPADSTDTPLQPGVSMPTAPYNELEEVTAPVAGTETQRPLNETRIETDVRVGDPMAPEVAFPWTLPGRQSSLATEAGGVVEGQSPEQVQADLQVESAQRNRTMASIRLARLRVQAGTASGTDDLAEAGRIEADASLSDDVIEHEIGILSSVVAQKDKARKLAANQAPKTAGVARTMPSMVGDSGPLVTHSSVSEDIDDAADLFL
jgi:hypothetical protein